MSVRFFLPNGSSGQYEWGSLLVYFDSPVYATTLPRIFASFAEETAMWNTAAEFRATVALMHETVHYLQDMLTGVGYWDYLVRRSSLSTLLSSARTLSRVPGLSVPYRDQALSVSEIENARNHIVTSSIYIPTARLSTGMRDDLVAAIRSVIAAEVPQGEEEAFLVENLLEAEAAAVVCLQILTLKRSKRQQEIGSDNSQLWLPDKMGDPYRSTLEGFFDAINRAMGDEATVQAVINSNPPAYMRTLCELVAFFLDLACAHPSPRLLAKLGLLKSDFHPGIKFLRLVRRLHELSDESTRDFFDAFNKSAYGVMEELLFKNGSFGYLPSRDIYEDWADVFQELAQNDNSLSLKLRLEACRSRLSHPSVCAIKALWGFLEHKIPIFVNTPNGFRSWSSKWEHLDPTEGATLLIDILYDEHRLALADYFFETGSYVCPLGTLHVCSAAESICCSGIMQNSQFPPEPGCAVRRNLVMDGFTLK